jgi:hypothetical protein
MSDEGESFLCHVYGCTSTSGRCMPKKEAVLSAPYSPRYATTSHNFSLAFLASVLDAQLPWQNWRRVLLFCFNIHVEVVHWHCKGKLGLKWSLSLTPGWIAPRMASFRFTSTSNGIHRHIQAFINTKKLHRTVLHFFVLLSFSLIHNYFSYLSIQEQVIQNEQRSSWCSIAPCSDGCCSANG